MAVGFRSSVGHLDDISVQMRNLEDKIMDIINQVDDAGPAIIYNALIPTFELSQELVPVQTGLLQSSGFLEVIGQWRRSMTQVVIGYGRHNYPHYAVYVHEMVHIPHSGGRQAKYLSAAIEQTMGDIEKGIVQGARRVLRAVTKKAAATKKGQKMAAVTRVRSLENPTDAEMAEALNKILGGA